MGLLLFLALSFLLATASSLRDVPRSSCSSKFQMDHHHNHHLNGSGLHLVLHHPRSPCSPATLHHLPFSTVLSHDDSRVEFLAARLTKAAPRPKSPLLNPDAASVPLGSGMSIGVGNYITRIGLGSPSTSYVMLVDTGSSLTWLQCSPCRVSCHEQVGSIFDPTTSATYRPVSCSAPECDGLESATLNPSACSASNVCIYQASYGDSSYSVGYLSRDSLSLGPGGVFPSFVYGCGQDNEGLFGRSAGLIGLARNKLSLLSQLAPKFGNAFSYCLPTTASTGYLSLGSYPPARYEYTPMVSSSSDASLYFVRLTGITVGGKGIAVAPSAYTEMPTIIDSGTVITRIPPDVYSALSKAVVAALRGRARAPAYSILDTCYKGSAKGLVAPEVDMVFQGGATLKLPTRNVMIDVDSGTTCLAFAPSERVAIIGNRQQQTFRVAYDVARSRIGFAAGGCA
ncbi:aspartyl protease family protein At5g10770-like [Phoenix dactylifera]|uniref:Aspartyl protease family protein At5g10770-like n=1 Tax=Phoenix dactylifera TaxID=42345 RepID=A0A8B7CCZ4_PHODC|nr:aspartyl protease family protein At5g10770-like [Phoenix dactylifera]